MSKYLGETIRGYKLDQEIGSGGFGTVYKATHQVLGRQVAAKVIKEKFVNEPQFVRQFESEARIIAGLEHFNIVPLYDFFRDPSGALLVMRWLPGGSLRQLLKKGRMTTPQIVRTFNQIVRALAFAHRHNVIHRDIKPENILLDDEGNAFLTDFGIAVDMRNRDEQNIDNISFGSPDYVAPEQLGKEKQLTYHSDIYSLGIMLYELLAHQRPFVSKDPKEIIRMQMYHPVPSLRIIRPDLPPEIDTIIWNATAKNPSMRYDTVIKFAQDFQKLAQRVEPIRSDYLLPTPEETLQEVKYNTPFVTNPTDAKTEVFPTGSIETELLDEQGEARNTYASKDDVRDSSTPAIGPLNEGDDTPSIETIIDILVPEGDNAGRDAEMTANLYPDDDADLIGTINLPEMTALQTAQLYSSVLSNPFKGLRAFGEGDTDNFFGREALVKTLLEQIADEDRRFMALVGRSGNGKSSIVRAGIIPALKQDAVPAASNWFYSTMVPSNDPYRELSDALLSIAIFAPDNWSTLLRSTPDGLHELIDQMLPDDGSEVFLFIDQFEELFTLTQSDEVRTNFLTSLAYAVEQPNSRLRLILTMRADFFGYPLNYESFADLFSRYNQAVPPLNRAQLQTTIVEPARRAGIIVEPALVAALLEAVDKQPGALPLLQYTLTEMVNTLIMDGQQGNKPVERLLTLATYEAMGGIAGALVQRADSIYNQLEPEAQDLTRLLFLNIVTVSKDNPPTSRSAIWTDLPVKNRDLLESVIEAFRDYRLLTTDQDPETRAPTVEVAHEALIQEWTPLREWIENNASALRQRDDLEIESARWHNNDKEVSFLASGLQLAEFESLLDTPLINLNKDEYDYIRASRDEEDRELRETRRRNRLLQFLATGLAVVAMATIAVTLIALQLRDQATDNQLRAENNLRLARSRELAASAIANADENDLSLLLGVEAYTIDPAYEALNSLLSALQSSPLLSVYLHGHTAGVQTVSFDTTGNYAVSAGLDRQIIRWDLTTNEPIGEPLIGHMDRIWDVDVSVDGIIASASADGTVRLWDFDTGEEITVLEHDREVYSLTFNPDGTRLATSFGIDQGTGTILIWNTETLERVERLDDVHDGIIYTLDYDSNGTRLVSGGQDAVLRLWDTNDYSLESELNGHSATIRDTEFDPFGNALASTGHDRSVIIWNPNTGEPLTILQDTGHEGDVLDLAYDSTGTFLATASADSNIFLWDLSQRFQRVGTISTHAQNVWAIDFGPRPEDARLLSVSDDSTVIQSSLRSIPRPATLSHVHSITVNDMVASDDYVVIAGQTSNNLVDNLQIINRDTGRAETNINLREIFEVAEDESLRVTDLHFNQDNTRVALALSDGNIAVWDIANARLAWSAGVGTATVRAIVYTQDGSRIVSADDAGTVAVWEATDGTNLAQDLLPDVTESITTLAISPDDTTLAMGFRNGNLILWDLATNTQRFETIAAHDSTIEAITFDQLTPTNLTSQFVFTASRDSTITQWRLSDGTAVQSLTAHEDWVFDVTVSPDNRLIASGDRDGGVRLWDFTSGRPIGGPITNPDGWIRSVQFVDARTLLASNETLGITFTIDLTVANWISDACTRANRPLNATEWGQFFPGEAYNPVCHSPSPDTTQTP